MNAFRPATAEVVIRHGHMAFGLGAGAAGMNAANPRVGPLRGRFECAGGIDVDEGAIRNFERLTGVKGTIMDLFSEAQYRAFHGEAPPPGWREATPRTCVACSAASTSCSQAIPAKASPGCCRRGRPRPPSMIGAASMVPPSKPLTCEEMAKRKAEADGYVVGLASGMMMPR